MRDQRYRLLPYSHRMPPLAPLLDLVRLAFSHYAGVIDAREPFLRWFLARPGLDRDLSWAGWDGNTLVSSLFVTRSSLAFSGTPRSVGLVDTVMTHPHHRRRGLARELLCRAIESSQTAGLEALQLYTAPGSAGYYLYHDLGFTDRASMHYWELNPGGPDPEVLPGWRPVMQEEEEQEQVRDALRAAASRYDGMPHYDDQSWRWRRLERPATLPAEVWLRDDSSETVTAAAVCLTGLGDRLVLSDPLVTDAAGFSHLCRHLVQRVPLVAIADERDTTLTRCLTDAGFSRGQAESVLILPLVSGFPCQPGGLPWFALTESVIGV